MPETVRTSLQEVGETGIVHIVCHSQGVQICQNVLSNLTPQERARVVVSAFGGATFIDDSGLAGALNYISTRDPIPFLGDFFHFTKAILASSPKVVVLPSRSSSIFDHSIMGDTYVDGMKQDAQHFTETYLN